MKRFRVCRDVMVGNRIVLPKGTEVVLEPRSKEEKDKIMAFIRKFNQQHPRLVRLDMLHEIHFPEGACERSCDSGQWRPGGKCEINGCYKNQEI